VGISRGGGGVGFFSGGKAYAKQINDRTKTFLQIFSSVFRLRRLSHRLKVRGTNKQSSLCLLMSVPLPDLGISLIARSERRGST
jgi:hypothetical protein